MPQRGGLRLAVFALTCAAGLAMAGTASANEIVLEAGALHVAPNVSPSVSVPPGLVLKQALLTRSTTFPEGVEGKYSATYRYYTGPDTNRTLNSDEIDSAATSVNGDVSPAITHVGADPQLVFSITGAGASADLTRVGLKVDDPAPPSGAAVGGLAPGGNITSPDAAHNAANTIDVWANDVGSGLWRAELWVDGVLAGTFKYVNPDGSGGACVNAVETGQPLPLNNDCLKNYSDPKKGLLFDSTRWPDGKHTATVKIFDVSGNVSQPLTDAPFEITNHPKTCGNPCNENLNIGSGNSSQQNGSNNGNNGTGGVAGASETSCNSPRLSMELSQRPLKVSKGVPLLVSGKRYRFRGKLTCLVDGKRRSAPVKTAVELLNTIGKHTYRKGGATVRSNGAITLILSYKSSRTLIFRYTNPDGRRSQVKLKIKVVKKSR
jgi:hypothetical protein